MIPQELIRKKRDGLELTLPEIEFLVGGLTSGQLSEGQVAAFAMAVYYPILQQTGQSFSTVWGWFAQPFIIGDTLKAVIATGLVFAGSAFVNRIRG